MPTPTKGRRMGGSAAHQQHMLANLATALFEHGKITTTEARARRLRPVAERLITFAKRGDLHARRQVLTVVTDKTVVHDALRRDRAELRRPRRAATPGSPRSARARATTPPMAVIELVREEAEAEAAAAAAGARRAAAAAARAAQPGGGCRPTRRGSRGPRPRTLAAEDGLRPRPSAEADDAEARRRGRGRGRLTAAER